MPFGFISASKIFHRAMGNWYQTCRWEHQRWGSSYMIPQSLSGQREMRQSALRTIPILAYYDQDKQLNFLQMLQRVVCILSYCRQRETVGSQWHMLLDPWLRLKSGMHKSRECLGLTYVSLLCTVYGLTQLRQIVVLSCRLSRKTWMRCYWIPRLDMKMQRYDFELPYTGKHLVLANTLSTAPEMNQTSATEK